MEQKVSKFIITLEHLEALFNCILEAKHKHLFPDDVKNLLNHIKSKLIPYEEKLDCDGKVNI